MACDLRFCGRTHPSDTAASMSAALDHINRPRRGSNEFIDLDAAAAQPAVEVETTYDRRDLSLYALGVGAARIHFDPAELVFLNERSDGFQPLPTYAAIPAANAMMKTCARGSEFAGVECRL